MFRIASQDSGGFVMNIRDLPWDRLPTRRDGTLTRSATDFIEAAIRDAGPGGRVTIRVMPSDATL